MKKFGELIYTPEEAPEEVISKAETHTPKIEVPERVRSEEPFKVRITVGPHPNQVSHSIRYIKVYYYEEGRAYNPIHIITITLEPEYAEPDITITMKVKKPGLLYVIEYCNLHGLWEARKKISIE